MSEHQSRISQTNILVVDDTPKNLQLLVGLLKEQGYKVYAAPNGPRAIATVQKTPPDLILLDIRMPEMDGFEVCEKLKTDERTRDIPVIFLSALDEVVSKIKGFEAGGVDYITKPFQVEEVLARVETHVTLQKYRKHLEELVDARTRALRETHEELQTAFTEIQQLKNQLQEENIYFREEIKLEHNFEEIIGHSEALNDLLLRVQQVAPTDTTILILGETGTGKELIARALHHASPRKDRPLVKVNCAALPTHLIESEVFGHEKGAFTGATTRRIGRFELADKATLFLDEIGELPLELQSKLLRVIQEGEFERLGSSRTLKVDVRVIAATNRNLEVEVRAGRFRQDLYYRLSVYPLSVPPLRERQEDIPLLVRSFAQKFSKKLGKPIETISQKTLHALQQYDWPGNVRELENMIERAVITTQDRTLRVDVPQVPMRTMDTEKSLEDMERDYILHILNKTHWKIEGTHGAALVLGLHPSTLRSRMHKLGIKRQ
jgi:DNA-binding NtrC family response regulator